MECNEIIQTVQEQPARLLKCSKCGELKSPDEFYRSGKNGSGRSSRCSRCIKCVLAGQKERYARKRGRETEDAEADQRYAGPPGEYADEQVRSVIKAMAALENQVKETTTNTKMRIEAVEAEGARVVDDVTSRIELLRQELKRMCARLAMGKKPFSAFCLYGRAHYYDGELSVTLFPAVVHTDGDET